MIQWQNEKTDRLCHALLCLKDIDECRAFLDDVCTIKEIQEISQRLAVAEMIGRGCSYANILKETGVSTTTISRISRCCEYGTGGYQLVLQRLKDAEAECASAFEESQDGTKPQDSAKAQDSGKPQDGTKPQNSAKDEADVPTA